MEAPPASFLAPDASSLPSPHPPHLPQQRPRRPSSWLITHKYDGDVSPAVPSQAQVASVVAATHVGAKRRRAGQHVVATAAVSVAPATACLAPVAASLAPPAVRKKKASLMQKGAAGPKVKKTTTRKMEHMMKSREALTMKTLETKLLINEKKNGVMLAQVEARREEAKRKADLEERMIKVKEAKAWKELMVEEKEHMMMSKKDMDEDQLMWWKEYKEDIAERKRIFRG
ncbi:hypothetical protein ZWY2020_052574 [Hordeum vulgare]|nr:hypothetical protein ZWY2020_052574 [Hordeum vulgare]